MKTKNLLPFLMLCTFLVGCEDLFEKDLTAKGLQLNTPADQSTFHPGTIEFWWEAVDGAITYEIKVVKGTAQAPMALILDSSLTKNNFNLFLGPGDYHWSVTASNNSSSTTSDNWSFIIDSTSFLGNTNLVIQFPPNDFCLGDSVLALKWLPVFQNEVTYFIDLRKGNFEEGLILGAYESNETEITVDLPTDFEGALSIGVRALNDFSASPFSIRQIHLDLSKPGSGFPVNPTNGDTLTEGEITFDWQAGTDNGCMITDSIYVYSDSLLTSLAYKSGAATESHQVTIYLEKGKYWWNIVRFDRAGNISTVSSTRKINVTQ